MDDRFILKPSIEYTPSLSFRPPAKEAVKSKKPLGPPADTKKVLTEELARLRSSRSGSQTIDTFMSIDEQYLELREYSENPQLDDKYQQSFQDFTKRKVYEIPQSLISKFQENNSFFTLTGIIPEIGRVWFSHNNLVYFWDYFKTNSFLEYPASQDTIMQVSVIPKNSDLFTNKVKYMLLIASKTQIHFVGVSLDPEFKLIEANLKVNTDEVSIECVAALPNNRIMLGCADGSINELSYTSSWYTSTKRYKRSDISSNFLSFLIPKFIKEYNPCRVSQISVDSSRNILYSLVVYDKGGYRLEVYDLGIALNKHKRVCKIPSKTLLQRIRDTNQRMYSLHPERLEVKFIQALTREFSNSCHLLAVTKNGIRIFFSFAEVFTEECKTDPVLSCRPCSNYSFTLKFPPSAVRLMDKIDLNPSSIGNISDKPVIYEKFVFTESGSLVLEEKTENSSRLLCIGRSLTRIALLQSESLVNEPDEAVSCFDDIGLSDVLNLKVVKSYRKMTQNCAGLCNYVARSEFRDRSPLRYLGCNAGMLSFQCLSNLSNILYKPPCDLLVLTTSQLVEYTEIRPIDLLYQALASDEAHRVGEFIHRFGMLHTCVMLLSLIVGPVHVSFEDDTIISPVPEREKTRAFDLFKQLGNNKVVDNSFYTYKLEDPLMSLAEFKSLYLYTARVLRPVWEENISFCEGECHNQIEQFQASQLYEVKQRLEKFKEFVFKNYQDHLKKSGTSVYNLMEFIKRNEDFLELLSMITEDYIFRRVVSELTQDDQLALKEITYRNLVSTPRGHHLAKALTDSYIYQQRSLKIPRSRRLSLTDCLKNLAAKCSSFFTTVDSEIYIAQECLQKAIVAEGPTQKTELLEEAMKRLLRNAASVGLSKISSELKKLGCYRGIVYLCVQKVLDVSDIKGDDGKEEIEECYCIISRILSDLKDLLIENNTATEWFAGIGYDKANAIKDEIIYELMKHHEKNAHYLLFTWMNECHMISQILQLESPFLKSFIEEKRLELQETDLFARYCFKMMDYLNSYKEFDKIATSKNKELTIEKRLEYLEFCTSSLDKFLDSFKGGKEEKKVYEEEKETHISKKTLARIQLKLKHTMKEIPVLAAKTDPLDHELLKVSDLYQDYSKAHNLYTMQFEILDYIRSFTSMDKKEVENSMRSIFIPLIAELSSEPWPRSVHDHLLDLGTKFPYCFNTELIINKVEKINTQKGIEKSWLVELLASLPVQVTYAQIWTFYYGHWKNSIDPDSLYFFSLRCEALLKIWFNDLKKRLVDSAVWNKNSKEKAPPHEFAEKFSELVAFFDQARGLFNSIPGERGTKICHLIGFQENVFNTLRVEFMPAENNATSLRRKINFDALDSGSEKSSLVQKKAFK